jgi:hypothetical protein
MKLAQKFLGHSNMSTTADVYVHAAKGAEQVAANVLEEAIFGNLFVTVPNSTNKNDSGAVN